MNNEKSLNGMTLRDYFAAKAMQGFLSNKAVVTRLDDYSSRENIAAYAYHVANMMMDERAEEI
jgi:ribosomal protein S17E